MRIGFYTAIEDWGGSETFLRDLMLGVRAAGHDPVLVGIEGTRLAQESAQAGIECCHWRQYPGKSAGDSIGMAALPSEAPVPTDLKAMIRRAVPAGARLVAGNVREGWNLGRRLTEARIDVLHININGYENAALGARRLGIPCAGCFLIVPPPEDSRTREWLGRWTARLYDKVVFQSQSSRHAVMRRFPFLEPISRTIPNGIGIDRLPVFPDRSARPGSLRLLAMGRLHMMKGHDDTIRALTEIREPGVTLDILGEGPERETLEAAVRMSGLEGRVRLRGHVDDYASFLRESDAFVMPSVSHESCPAALLLAMAARLPVITSDLDALTEINQAGITGLVVSRGNSSELARAIRQLAHDPEARQRFGENGRARVSEFFSMPVMVREWLAVYAELAGSHASRRGGGGQ